MHSLSQKKLFQGTLARKLFEPVDNSPLILFRILFGFLLCFHCVNAISAGDVYENFIHPPFTFTFIGFEFLQPLPGWGMYFYFGLMALLGLMIMAGAWYRISMISFTILWAGVYLMQKSNYNNHYYLLLLLSFLMCLVPANACCAIDTKRRGVAPTHTCSKWVYWIFIAQMAIVYFFGALNKITPDWLSGKFISIMFERMTTHRFVGHIYASRFFQHLVCYGGILFDAMIIPLLAWRKTRRIAFVCYCGFHIFNSYTFHIGIFPYLSIALAVFFFEPETIRRIFFPFKPTIAGDITIPVEKTGPRLLLLVVLSIYMAFQLLLPIRPWFFPGNVFWTEEGYRMSWKMMLRVKKGNVHFKVSDPQSGNTWITDPASAFAPSHVSWMAICPDITWQYAQRLKKEFVKKGYPNVKVYAIDSVSLNRNPPQLLIDTTADLGSIDWEPFRHADWILPYKQP